MKSTRTRAARRATTALSLGALSLRALSLVVLIGLAGMGGAAAQSAGTRAGAGELSALVAKIDQLERQLRTVEETVFRGAPTPVSPNATAAAAARPPGAAPAQGADSDTPAIAQLTFRVQQFEEALQRLTGQIEEIQFQLRQVSDRLDRTVSDVEFRLSEIERSGGGGGASAGPLSTPSDSASASPSIGNEVSVTLPDGTPEEQYRFAQNFLVQRDFVRAEKALRQFIEANPDNQLAGDAQFWLGETYFIRNQYERAARAYAEGYRSFPQSAQAPNNLLKLAIALGNLEQTQNACITLDQLAAEFPSAPTNVLQRATIERERLGCSS